MSKVFKNGAWVEIGGAAAKVGDMVVAYDPSLLPAGTWVPADGTPIAAADHPDLFAFGAAHPALYPLTDKDSITLNLLPPLPGTADGDYTYGAELSPDGKVLISGLGNTITPNNRILIWGVSGTSFTLKGTFPVSSAPMSFQFSDDSKYVVSNKSGLFAFNVSDLDNIIQYTFPAELTTTDIQDIYGVFTPDANGTQHLTVLVNKGVSTSSQLLSYSLATPADANPFASDGPGLALPYDTQYNMLQRTPEGLLMARMESATFLYRPQFDKDKYLLIASHNNLGFVYGAVFAPNSDHMIIPNFHGAVGGVCPFIRFGEAFSADYAKIVDAGNGALYGMDFYSDRLLIGGAATDTSNRIKAYKFSQQTKELTPMTVSPVATNKVIYSVSCYEPSGLVILGGYTDMVNGIEVYQKTPATYRAVPEIPGPYYIKAAD